MLFGGVDEIVYGKGVAGYIDYWVVLRVQLPIAVIVEDVQQTYGIVSQSAPALQSD
jgi:hypothetical protein